MFHQDRAISSARWHLTVDRPQALAVTATLHLRVTVACDKHAGLPAPAPTRLTSSADCSAARIETYAGVSRRSVSAQLTCGAVQVFHLSQPADAGRPLLQAGRQALNSVPTVQVCSAVHRHGAAKLRRSSAHSTPAATCTAAFDTR